MRLTGTATSSPKCRYISQTEAAGLNGRAVQLLQRGALTLLGSSKGGHDLLEGEGDTHQHHDEGHHDPYGEVVVDSEDSEQLDGQMSIADFGLFDKERPLLKRVPIK